MPRRPRLDPAIFHLPVERMRQGYYSDKYFARAREVLLADGHRPHVLMQVFGKAHAYLGGADEAIAMLRLCAVEWGDLVVHALYDGDEIWPWETVMTIEGPYDVFAHLETLYLGENRLRLCLLVVDGRIGACADGCTEHDAHARAEDDDEPDGSGLTRLFGGADS